MAGSLFHWGILGMRWGVRRQRGPDGRVVTGIVPKVPSEDHKTSRELSKKSTAELSTKELQTLIQRAQLEKQYKDLKPSDFKRGHEFVKNLVSTGTTVSNLYSLTKTPLAQDIQKAASAAKKVPPK